MVFGVSRKVPSGWQFRRIDELGKVQAGRQRSPHFQEGTLRPYLRVANIFDGYIATSDILQMFFTDDEFERYRLESGDILLNEGQSLELVGRCAMYEGFPENCCFQNTLVRFRANSFVDPAFMLNLFRHLQHTGKFKTIASQTTSIAHLGVSRFAGLKVLVPSMSEQRAIDRVLALWDRALEQTERLIAAKQQRKQALMHQLLTGKRRFREFVRSKVTHHTPFGILPIDWKMVRLSRVVQSVKRKNAVGCVLVLTASGQQGLMDQREFFNRSVAGEKLEGYYLLKKREFAYNRSSMKGYPYGAIKRLDAYEQGVVSILYLCFSISSIELDSDFATHFFESGLLNSQLRGIAQVGARAHGLLNVTASDFMDMSIPLPSLDEQRRIAAMLTTCDAELRLLRAQASAIKQQKKGLMQKLLNGEVRTLKGRKSG